MPLTPTQGTILAAIHALTAEHKYAPTLREIADRAGMASPSAVSRQIDRLVELGYVDRQPGTPRSIRLAHGLTRAAVPTRPEEAVGAVRDALCGTTLGALTVGQRVSTSAPRRVGQLHHACPGVEAVPIRGNVPPRLRQMRERGLSGVVLAAAGLHRLSLQENITQYLDPTQWPPSPAQGAIAVQVRSADTALARVVAAVHDAEAAATTQAERALMQILGGGCHVPTGAYASIHAGQLHLLAQVTSTDGRATIRAEATGETDHPEMVGERVAQLLLEKGVEAVLASNT
ncbi:hydroxymethylbilane synthase [Nocardiopsis sp. JB363]|uniref:hydroxymethylbilane synthase n=1 Tax=Nocardiopsis sp. JB363 TaxID=1434837 RepID=UPI00097A0011|nr:hydroxymethylbilane synthase [Nocardiopsis sp. JB363]SIO88521.1 Porphobilinogen deaminase [Nocardiopsis sp. JB363]